MNISEIKDWLLSIDFKLLKKEYSSSFINSIEFKNKEYAIEVETTPFFITIQVYTYFNLAKDVLFYCKLDTEDNDIELIKLIINSFMENK